MFIRTCFLGAIMALSAAHGQVSVLTGQYDINRTGANLAETTLTTSNVNSNQFGLLFTRPVDSLIFAQPLYVSNLNISGSSHNVVLVATMNNSVYAFDADSPSASAPLWQVSLGTPVTNVNGPIPSCGILSTPVIDLQAGLMYVVTLTKENGDGFFRIHELSLATGAEVVSSVVIQGSVPGTGDGSRRTACPPDGTVQPCVAFSVPEELQRPALLEYNGVVYVTFGTRSSLESVVPYHGWLFGYQTGTLARTAIFNSSPNGSTVLSQPPCSAAGNPCGHASGIWMSGRGPAADSGGVYLVTGNGGFGSGGNYGESVLRLNASGQVQDTFTDASYALWNALDLDFGAGGTILLPNTNLLIAGGKTGVVFVLNRANLGNLSVGNRQAVQAFNATAPCGQNVPTESSCHEIHSPAYWARTGANPLLYVWGWDDVLRAYDLVNGQFTPDVDPAGAVNAPNYPGGALAISANGSTAGSGVLWALVSTSSAVPAGGALYAFDASNIAKQLWLSSDNPNDGAWNNALGFTIPTVANGKVYVATSSNQIRVYGLCSLSTPCYPNTPGQKP